MCYDKGIFQQIIDGEYEEDIEEVKKHIANCDKCKEQFEEVQNIESLINYKLNKEFKAATMRRIDVEYQLFKFYQKEKGRKNMNSKVRKLAVAAATLTILIGSISYEPIRVKAANLLNVFRVNEVTGISITNDNVNKIEETLARGEGKVEMEDFVSAEVKSKEEPIQLSKGEISNEAAKKYKEDSELIKVDDSLEYGNMEVQPEKDVTLKFNVGKVNDFLQYLGEDKKLPEEMDQKEFVIHTGKAIYYTINAKNDEKHSKYISVTQIGTPTLTLPEGVDQKQIVDILLSLKLLPQNIKDQLSNIGDLSTTLPVPYIEGKDTKTDITIKGQKAILIERKDNDNECLNVVFKKGDSLFTIFAKGFSQLELTTFLEAME